MQPSLGWTFLSQRAIRHAEASLREYQEGVRDEIGFLFLHERFADRFFPGTSVQHTRLRYALFVPWIYQTVAEKCSRSTRAVDQMIDVQEVRLTGQLLIGREENQGVIGQLLYDEGKPSSQPATMVYWSALNKWGILRSLPDGSTPPRRAVHSALAAPAPRSREMDDDGNPLEEPRSIFINLPKTPKTWDLADKELNFALSPEEKIFLRNQLLTTRIEGSEESSLLARLAKQPDRAVASQWPWKTRVSEIASPSDTAALRLAKNAAGLAAIGRAVYAALVEERREADGLATSRLHREHLRTVRDANRNDAEALDIPELMRTVSGIPSFLHSVLQDTQAWANSNRGTDALLDLYCQVERKRKGSRARLAPTPTGRERRAEWDNTKHPEAERLHYRWRVVQRLLGDLL